MVDDSGGGGPWNWKVPINPVGYDLVGGDISSRTISQRLCQTPRVAHAGGVHARVLNPELRHASRIRVSAITFPDCFGIDGRYVLNIAVEVIL